MSSLRETIDARNGELLGDTIMQGVMGAGFSVVTFGAFWFITWMLLGGYKAGYSDPIPLGVTAIYVAAATWSAWRGVDPVANLVPLTRGEAAKREIEDAVRNVVGGGFEKIARRESIAGCANVLIAGPKCLLAAWSAWRKRVNADPALIESAAALLGEDPRPVEGSERGALLLVHLGLASLELGADGDVVVVTTAKGKQVS